MQLLSTVVFALLTKAAFVTVPTPRQATTLPVLHSTDGPSGSKATISTFSTDKVGRGTANFVSDPASKRELSSPLVRDHNSLHPRGETYNVAELDDLEEEAEEATQGKIDQSIDYIIDKIFKPHNIDYVLIGGNAMQKYGMKGRSTRDSDFVVNVKMNTLTAALESDSRIRQPTKMLMLSGVARIFVPIEDSPIGSDIFYQGKFAVSNSLQSCSKTDAEATGSDRAAPSMDSPNNIGGYKVASVQSMVKSKISRCDDTDVTDLTWFAREKTREVMAFADDVRMADRLRLVALVEESDAAALSIVRQAFRVR